MNLAPGAQNKRPRQLQDVRRGQMTRTAKEVEQLLLRCHGRSFNEAGHQAAAERGCSFEAIRRSYNTWMRSDPRFLRLPESEFALNKRFLRNALVVCRELAGASPYQRTEALIERMPSGWASRWPQWLIMREVEIVRATGADVWTNVGPNQHWFGNKLAAVSAFMHIANASKMRAVEMSGLHRSEVDAVFQGDPSMRALSLMLVLASCGIQVALVDANGAMLELSSEDSCRRVMDLAERLGWEKSE